MSNVSEELEIEVVWCYCCEDYTPHEVYQDGESTLYQCDCGCVLDSEEDKIVKQ